MSANHATIGFVGLGAMGAPMVERLIGAGHRLLVHDMNPAAVAQAVALGATALPSAAAHTAPAMALNSTTPDPIPPAHGGAQLPEPLQSHADGQ